MHTLTKLAGAIAGAAAASIIAAGPASADAETLDELAYIMALDEEGIAYSTEDNAIALGYGTCNALDAGASVEMVVLAGIDGADGYFSDYEVGYITGAAIAAFCPEYLDEAGVAGA